MVAGSNPVRLVINYKMTEEIKFDITKHVLVPEHIKVTGEDKGVVLKQLNVSLRQLPKILKDDAAIKNLEAKKDDIIKIIRKSPTAGATIFYRIVI